MKPDINKKRQIILYLLTIIFAAIVGGRYLYKSPKTAVVEVPEQKTRLKGEIFTVPVVLDKLAVPINAAQIDLSYDSTKLRLLGFDHRDSFANIFLEESIDNGKGVARIAGGLPNPGFSQKKGHFTTLYFEALSSGRTTINYLPSSLILANDGHATNVMSLFPQMSIEINTEEVDPGAAKTQRESFEKLQQDPYGDGQISLEKQD